jgi:hypothetical protein
MGQRNWQADAARFDLPPARGQMPEQQAQPDIQPRLGGDRSLQVQTPRPSTRAPQQCAGELWPACRSLSKNRVQQGKAAWHQGLPFHLASQQFLILSALWLDQVPGAN